MAKSIIFTILFFLHCELSAQNLCADSSQFNTLKLANHERIHTISSQVSNDGSILSTSLLNYGIQNSPASDEARMIIKQNPDLSIAWSKTINYNYALGAKDFQSINFNPMSFIASNGNIIFTNAGYIGAGLGNQILPYLVFSPEGALIKSDYLYIPTLNKPEDYGSDILRPNFMGQYTTDSILLSFVATSSFDDEYGEKMIIICMSNNGEIGWVRNFRLPTFDTHKILGYKITNDYVDIIGIGANENCHLSETFVFNPSLHFIRLNKQMDRIIGSKAYCQTPIYNMFLDGLVYTLFFDEQNFGSYRPTNYFLLTNGNIVFTTIHNGYRVEGRDTIAYLFNISEFDHQFNLVKSEYITARNRFLDAKYNLIIDSIGQRHFVIRDGRTQQIVYGVASSKNEFYFQKKIDFAFDYTLPDSKKEFYTRDREIAPGYFTSFSMPYLKNNEPYIGQLLLSANDTNQICFGTNVDYLSIVPTKLDSVRTYPERALIRNWAFDTKKIPLIVEDFPITSVPICKITNYCNAFWINKPEKYCFTNSEVIITTHKNVNCRGPVLFYFDTAQVASYAQPNDTTLVLQFQQNFSGKIVSQPSSCDLLSDSVEISVILSQPTLQLGVNTMLCPGATILLDASHPLLSNYRWQDGQEQPVYSVEKPGTYFVSAFDQCGQLYSDTVVIHPLKPAYQPLLDTTICLGETIRLMATENYLSYQWQPLENATLLSPSVLEVMPTINKTYLLTAEPFVGCKITDTVTVNVRDCPQHLLFPNSFTPNNDGINDSFKPFAEGVLTNYQLSIFNRWGELVFKTNQLTNGWNGQIGNKPQPIGTYTWICEFQFYGQPKKQLKGTIILIR